jgi:hypothetical protein
LAPKIDTLILAWVRLAVIPGDPTSENGPNRVSLDTAVGMTCLGIFGPIET